MSYLLALLITCGSIPSLKQKTCQKVMVACMNKYDKQFSADIFGPKYCAVQYIKRVK